MKKPTVFLSVSVLAAMAVAVLWPAPAVSASPLKPAGEVLLAQRFVPLNPMPVPPPLPRPQPDLKFDPLIMPLPKPILPPLQQVPPIKETPASAEIVAPVAPAKAVRPKSDSAKPAK